MLRTLRLALALAALWFWASLAPQVTYSSATTGDPSGEVLIAWPGWSVQQDLGSLSRTVGRFQISLTSRPDEDPVTILASLLDATTGEVLRQTSIDTMPSTTRPRTLDFPGYVVPSGQRLLLQLQVAEFEHGYALYHLAASQAEHANLAVNNVANAADGPLAYSHLETGSGIRAAVLGDPFERARLALGALFSGLALCAHPRVVKRLRRAGSVVIRWARWWRIPIFHTDQGLGHAPVHTGRVLTTPWYPWVVTTVPILHFIANNPLHFSAIEAVFPIFIALAIVTTSVVSLRLVLNDWHRPAAATAAATVIFFSYGHVDRALGGALDDRFLFPAAVVLGTIAVAMVLTTTDLARRGTQFANLTAAILLVFPIADLVGEAVASGASKSELRPVSDAPTAHLPSLSWTNVSDERPDIYYIILDAYGRDENLDGFDNASFVRELERRGFYVASNATSNYRMSIRSIPSTLNLAYLQDLGSLTPASELDLRNLVRFNALASILQSLGYAYVHLESGYEVTDESPIADVSVTFTPAGTLVRERGDPASAALNTASSLGELPFAGRVLRELLRTTALRPLVDHRAIAAQKDPYDWWVADRALRMFEFLSGPIEVGRPKFVFAHIVKPHLPATFDRYGNKVIGISERSEFDDDHDPSVPNAYIGQLIYINELVIRMVDSILRNDGDDTIIVVAGDHGADYSHEILAAFHLPKGGGAGLYPSISSVNHFRYILDYYLDLDIGLLEDRIERVDRQLRNFRTLVKELPS